MSLFELNYDVLTQISNDVSFKRTMNNVINEIKNAGAFARDIQQTDICPPEHDSHSVWLPMFENLDIDFNMSQPDYFDYLYQDVYRLYDVHDTKSGWSDTLPKEA